MAESSSILRFPVDRLRIGRASKRVLLGKGIRSVGDVLSLKEPFVQLKSVAFGKGKILNILNEIENLERKGVTAYVNRPANIVEFVTNILQNLKEKGADVVTMRIGFGGKPMTLEEIGKQYKKTRQWAQLRQREALEMMQEDHPEAVDDLLSSVQTALENNNQFCQLTDLASIPYLAPMKNTGLITHVTVGRLVMLLTDREIRIYEDNFLTTFNDEELDGQMDIIGRHLRRQTIPFPIHKLYETVKEEYPDISLPLFNYYLFSVKNVETDKHGNVILLKGLSLLDKICVELKPVNDGMHYKAILDLMRKSRFAEDFMTVSELNIHNRMDMDNRFLLVNRGTFILKENFHFEDQEAVVDEARTILKALGKPTDAAFLLARLSEMLPWIKREKINKYVISSILKGVPGFTSGRQLVVGLEEFGMQSPAEITDILTGILDESPAPLPTGDIYSRLLRVRGTAEYVVRQILATNPRFLRFGLGIYGLRKHIPFDDETITAIQQKCKERLKQNHEMPSSYGIARYLSFASSETTEKKLRENLLPILALSEDFEVKGMRVKLRADSRYMNSASDISKAHS